MAGQKILEHDGQGGAREAEAVQTGGDASANKVPALDASGRLDQSMMPTGIGADTAVIEASEALSAGNLVSVFDDAGTAKVRKADATANTAPAHGFVKEAFATGEQATVYFEGNNSVLSGLTAGRHYLSTTAGAVTATPPTGAGNLVQRVGLATSATTLNFEADSGVVLA